MKIVLQAEEQEFKLWLERSLKEYSVNLLTPVSDALRAWIENTLCFNSVIFFDHEDGNTYLTIDSGDIEIPQWIVPLVTLRGGRRISLDRYLYPKKQ